MKVKTLTYIHETLIHAEAVAAAEKKLAAEALANAEDGDVENQKVIRANYEKLRDAWRRANDALLDFEERDW